MGGEVKKKVEDAHAGTGQLAESQGAKVLRELVPEIKGSRFALPRENGRQSKQKLGTVVDAGIESLHELSKRGPEIKKLLDELKFAYEKKAGFLSEGLFKELARGNEKPPLVANTRAEARRNMDDWVERERESQYKESKAAVSFFRRIGHVFSDTFGELFGRIRIAAQRGKDKASGIIPIEQAGETAREWVAGELDPKTAERFNNTKPVILVFGRGIMMEGDIISGNAGAMYLWGSNQIVVNPYVLGKLGTAERLEILAHESFHYASYLGGGLSGIRWRDDKGNPRFVEREEMMWIHEGITELLAQQLVHSKGYQTTKGSYPVELTAAYLLQQLVGPDALKEAYLGGDFTKIRSVVNEKLGPLSFEKMMAGTDSAECLMRLVGMIKEKKADVENPLENWLIKAAGVLDGVWNAQTD